MQNLGKEISSQKEQNVQRLEVGVVFSHVLKAKENAAWAKHHVEGRKNGRWAERSKAMQLW